MSNNYFILFKNPIGVQVVIETLCDINKQKFNNKCGIAFDDYDNCYIIKVNDYNLITFLKISKTKLSLAMIDHPFFAYILSVYMNELAVKFDAKISDDVSDAIWAPVKNKYINYRDYIEKKHKIIADTDIHTFARRTQEEIDLAPPNFKGL